MAISLLANCGGGDKPGPVINTCTFTFNCPGCKVLDKQGNVITTVKVPVVEGSDDHYAKFYINGDDLHHSPLGSSIAIKKGVETITDYFYRPTTGEIALPLVGDLTITAEGFNKSLEECTWAQINEISTSGRAKEFFSIYDPSQPTLNCKRVQLKHQDTAGDGADKISEGELYQTVRIIGFNEDYTELPPDGGDPDPENAIGITFEFADLISDQFGYSLSTQWNDANDKDSSNYNYLDSSLRMALVGKKQDKGHILWAQKERTEWSNEPSGLYTDKSVLDMLPDELTKEGILKCPAKYINIYNTELATPAWEEQVVNDKLFLLSPKEIGNTVNIQFEEPHTTLYSYYKNAKDIDRVKKQIKGDDPFVPDPIPVIPKGKGQSVDDRILNYAGYNNALGGGITWLRSPYTNFSDFAWYVNSAGYPSNAGTYVYDRVFAIAPAFCI